MCEFISWIEKNGKVLFLTEKLVNSPKGEKWKKYAGENWRDDLPGHGAIRFIHSLEGNEGVNKEQTDFSSPDSFPTEIVEAIKAGKMSGMGIAKGLLTKPAWAEYLKVEQLAWAEYEKVKRSAWAEYEKVKLTKPAWAEYEEVEQPAWAEYLKVMQLAFWDLFAIPENRNPNWR